MTPVATIPANWLNLEENKVGKLVSDVLTKRIEEEIGRVISADEVSKRVSKSFAPATVVYFLDGMPITQLQFNMTSTNITEINGEYTRKT